MCPHEREAEGDSLAIRGLGNTEDGAQENQKALRAKECSPRLWKGRELDSSFQPCREPVLLTP